MTRGLKIHLDVEIDGEVTKTFMGEHVLHTENKETGSLFIGDKGPDGKVKFLALYPRGVWNLVEDITDET